MTLGYSFTEHSGPKKFSLTDATCKTFPLLQSKCYHNQHCTICHHCRKAETSEKSNSQRKLNNLLVPGKVR